LRTAAGTHSDANSDGNGNSYIHPDANGYSHTDTNTYCHSDGNGHADGDCDHDAYSKAFTHTEATSDAATSPIAEKQVVTNVKWLEAREKSREFSS
jgi:hypothetical protein